MPTVVDGRWSTDRSRSRTRKRSTPSGTVSTDCVEGVVNNWQSYQISTMDVARGSINGAFSSWNSSSDIRNCMDRTPRYRCVWSQCYSYHNVTSSGPRKYIFNITIISSKSTWPQTSREAFLYSINGMLMNASQVSACSEKYSILGLKLRRL